MDFENLRSARTARTYPVQAMTLVHAVEDAARRLGGWELSHATEEEIRVVRRTRLGLLCDVTVRLTTLRSSAHTNTHAAFESASRVGPWDLGQNKRNLDELLRAIHENLMPEA